MSMEKFLSDKRKMAFMGAVLGAVYSWGNGFAEWGDTLTPRAIFGLCGILGSLFLSNQTNNVLRTPPLITVTTEPEEQVVVTTTTTTTPSSQAGEKP